MNRRKLFRSRTVLAVSVLGLLLAAAALPAGAARWLGEAWADLARAAPERAAPLNGTRVAYIGRVELEWVMPGEFSDPLPAPTPNPDPQAPPSPHLGEIDLALEFTRSGDTINGYVDLEFTLVFTGEHQLGSVWYGPSVEGIFDGENLSVTSERISLVSAGQRLMRQFRLVGAAVPEQEGTLSGQYRETVWGYGPQPMTVQGTFTLNEAVSDLGPSADLGAFPITGPAPLKVSFSDLSMGQPTSWAWDFGDGGSSTDQDPMHTYGQPGSYTVTLTVADDAGFEDTLVEPDYITVTAPAAPVAHFSAEPRSGRSPLTVAFEDWSAGGPTSWTWDFGDGGASTEQEPAYTYWSSGRYTVSLTVGNLFGSHTLSETNYITVLEAEKIYLPLVMRNAP